MLQVTSGKAQSFLGDMLNGGVISDRDDHIISLLNKLPRLRRVLVRDSALLPRLTSGSEDARQDRLQLWAKDSLLHGVTYAVF